MAFSDRPYYGEQQSYGGGGGSAIPRPNMWSVTAWLLLINIAVFVLDKILMKGGWAFGLDLGGAIVPMGPLELIGHLSATTAIEHLQVWRFITFQFLHADMGHIFGNMLALFFFGPFVERHLGSRRFLGFYLLCGLAGGVLYMLLWGLGMLIGDPRIPFLLSGSPASPMVGASAGIFGILVAAATVAPNMQVMLLFPPIPMKLKTLVWVFLGIAIFTVATTGHNAGGEAAHLGGAALGYLLIRRPQVLNIFDRASLDKLKPDELGRMLDRARDNQRQDKQRDLDAKVDRILDKVHREGLASLTQAEKRTLQRASKSKQR